MGSGALEIQNGLARRMVKCAHRCVGDERRGAILPWTLRCVAAVRERMSLSAANAGMLFTSSRPAPAHADITPRQGPVISDFLVSDGRIQTVRCRLLLYSDL